MSRAQSSAFSCFVAEACITPFSLWSSAQGCCSHGDITSRRFSPSSWHRRVAPTCKDGHAGSPTWHTPEPPEPRRNHPAPSHPCPRGHRGTGSNRPQSSPPEAQGSRFGHTQPGCRPRPGFLVGKAEPCAFSKVNTLGFRQFTLWRPFAAARLL